MQTRSQIDSSRASIAPQQSPLSRWHYFIVMRDFDKIGREATVDPQHTRRNIIDLIATREWTDVLFVHEVCDGFVSDVTEEIMEAAEREMEAA